MDKCKQPPTNNDEDYCSRRGCVVVSRVPDPEELDLEIVRGIEI